MTGSGRARVPINTPLAGFIGIGIAVAGGSDDDVRDNRVRASERYGIAVFPTARRIAFASPVAHDPGPPWRPSGNVVSRNTVSGSGIADLALANGVGPRNCFRANAERTSLPPGLDGRCTRAGDAGVARRSPPARGGCSTRPCAAAGRRSTTRCPRPPAQPNMP